MIAKYKFIFTTGVLIILFAPFFFTGATLGQLSGAFTAGHKAGRKFILAKVAELKRKTTQK